MILVSINDTNVAEALNHFEMDRTAEEILETHLTLETSPDYPIILEEHENRTGSQQGTHYRQSPESREYGEIELEIGIDTEEIQVDKVSINPESGEAELEFSSERGEDPRKYKILSFDEKEVALLAEVGYGERETAQVKYDKEEEKIKGRRSPEDSWKNYRGVRERYRIQLLEEIMNTFEDLREQPEEQFTGSKFQHLRPVYNAVTEKIDRNGKAIINEQTHVGSARGGDIKKDFKKAVRRVPDDTIDNYHIENDGNEYPIVITEN